MIITCTECSTGFNFDDSLIKENGSKVRCSICKHIFTVYPPPQEPEDAGAEIIHDLVPESDSAFKNAGENAGDLGTEESEFSFDEAKENDKGSDETETQTPYISSSAEYEAFSKASDPKREWFEIVLDDAKAQADAQSNGWNKQADEEIFLKEDLFMDHENLSDEEIFLRDELTAEEEAMLDEHHDENSASLKDPTIINDAEESDIAKEPEDPEEYVQHAAKKSKSIFSMLLLIIVLIFLLTVGTYVASMLTGYKIPYLSDVKIPVVQEYIEKLLPKEPDAKPVLNNNTSERFMTNTTVGTLLIITGQVDNRTKETFNYIEIETTLTTGEEQTSLTKKGFCGNIISDEMLRNGDIAEIEQLMMVREGQNDTNMNIKPDSSVPFMVIFSELPDKPQNYYIKVIGFEKTDRAN
jgi:predicted Zn finger-like uncharacterized protein